MFYKKTVILLSFLVHINAKLNDYETPNFWFTQFHTLQIPETIWKKYWENIGGEKNLSWHNKNVKLKLCLILPFIGAISLFSFIHIKSCWIKFNLSTINLNKIKLDRILCRLRIIQLDAQWYFRVLDENLF